MDRVVGCDVKDPCAGASAAWLQKAVDLARRILAAPIAMVASDLERQTVVHALSGSDHADSLGAVAASCHAAIAAGRPCVVPERSGEPLYGSVASLIAVPIRLPSRRDLGMLCVMDRIPRAWSDEDLSNLADLAEFLTSQIEHAEAARGAAVRLVAVADRIPGLVFERRKVDAARSRYTFFGASKTALPAVRQMMEHGVSSEFNFIHRDDREAVRAALLRSNLEETDLDLTFRVKDLDGGVRWLRSQSIVRREADGSVCWDGLCFDITDLAAARADAEAAQAAKDGLVADLRGPLEAITRFSQFLETEWRPDLVAVHARSIRAAVDSLLGMVDQIPIAGVPSAEMDEAAEPSRSAPPEPAPIRILLADDLDLNRKLIADMLTIEGHVVDCVADGAAAVNAASQRPYDLILMDMIMPGMDGITATRAIRALSGPASKVPIVALTANSFQEQLDSCLTAGMDATLTKPMSLEQLTSTVRAWARRAEHRSEQRQDMRGRNEAA